LKKILIYIAFATLLFNPLFAGDNSVKINIDSLRTEPGYFQIGGECRYHAGDNPAWAKDDYDDSNWRIGDSRIVPDDWESGEWSGIGWFRFKFDVDSSLWGKTIALHYVQAGASEIYLNGRKIHTFGRVGKYSEIEEAFWDQEFPAEFKFDSTRYQILSIRYSNFTARKIKDYGYGTGFVMRFFEIDAGIESRAERDRAVFFMIALFTAVPLIFALLHLSIFFYYRKDIGNLYFGIFTLCLSLINFFDFYIQLAGNPEEYLIFNLLHVFPVVISLIFLLLFSYDSFGSLIPKHFILFLLSGIALQFWAIFGNGGDVALLVNVYGGFVLLEILRVIITAFIMKKVKLNFLIFGFSFFVATLAIQTGARFGFEMMYNFDPLYYLGIIVLLATMSIHLSKNFAKVNRELEKEVERVKDLSEQKLQKEREAREKEITRKLLEADNIRKTEELNEARMLQMSMLPKNIPDFKDYKISAYIKTATEVGGDYYDFYQNGGGDFKMAIGDATGHGMKAGTLVSSTKSLFNALVEEHSPVEMIKRCNSAIKYMNLPNLYMSLSIVHFDANRFIYSSAGMPPVLLYRAKDKSIETITQKTMPLGGFIDFVYEEEEILLSKGDILLFSSDGFMELFDRGKNMLGLEGMKQYLLESISESTDEIMNKLLEKITGYSNGASLHDDLTLILVKHL